MSIVNAKEIMIDAAKRRMGCGRIQRHRPAAI